MRWGRLLAGACLYPRRARLARCPALPGPTVSQVRPRWGNANIETLLNHFRIFSRITGMSWMGNFQIYRDIIEIFPDILEWEMPIYIAIVET